MKYFPPSLNRLYSPSNNLVCASNGNSASRYYISCENGNGDKNQECDPGFSTAQDDCYIGSYASIDGTGMCNSGSWATNDCRDGNKNGSADCTYGADPRASTKQFYCVGDGIAASGGACLTGGSGSTFP